MAAAVHRLLIQAATSHEPPARAKRALAGVGVGPREQFINADRVVRPTRQLARSPSRTFDQPGSSRKFSPSAPVSLPTTTPSPPPLRTTPRWRYAPPSSC